MPALPRVCSELGSRLLLQVVLGARPEALAVKGRCLCGVMLTPLLLPCHRSSLAWLRCYGSKTWQPGAIPSPCRSIMAC